MKTITFNDLTINDTFINSKGNKTTVTWIHKNGVQLLSELGTEWTVSKSDFNHRVHQGCYTNFKLQKSILEHKNIIDIVNKLPNNAALILTKEQHIFLKQNNILRLCSWKGNNQAYTLNAGYAKILFFKGPSGYKLIDLSKLKSANPCWDLLI